MLRMPKFEVARPTSLEEAVALLASAGERAMLIAGGTDLLPNVKHRLFEPELVISLADVAQLRGIQRDGDGALVIGAMTTVDEVAKSALVQEHAPALAQATSLIAGPQLRRMGTLGGNVMLDTRCQWYNQTYFWRKSLGFCLKKDGSECHVVAGGSKCVAAASNDSAPALMHLEDRRPVEGRRCLQQEGRRRPDPDGRARPGPGRWAPRRLRQAARSRIDRLPVARCRRPPRPR
jgi:4-hydroxybenzoyl-CoA reductase subunit beta